MGSEDVDVQCQTQSASASVPCESAASYGIATVPFVASVSVAPNQSGTGTPVSANAVMIAQSAASHTPPQNVAVQPSVAASPLPHVQVIQQPLQNQYLQHLYAPQQQHMFLPGNLTLQPAIQSIGAGPAGISLQLQGKGMENKAATPTIISAAPMQTVGNFGTQSLIPAGSQMAATAKACVPGQMLAASSKSTVIQGQSGFIPVTSSNQTVVIGQLGVLSNPQTVLPHQAKAITDGQKGKSYLISQPATLHPKSPILPSPNVSCSGQMIATSQLKQIPSASHILTTQAPTMITNQAQLLGSLQALGVPPGITWATPGSLHSSALFGQNPIFIRSQQSDMFIQSPPPQATIHAVPVAPQIQQQPQQQQSQQVQQQQQVQTQTQQVQQQQQQQQQAQQQVQQQQSQQQVQQQTQQHQQVQQHQQIQQQVSQQQSIQPQTHTPILPAPSTPGPQMYKAKTAMRPGSSVATQTMVSSSNATSTSTTITKSQVYATGLKIGRLYKVSTATEDIKVALKNYMFNKNKSRSRYLHCRSVSIPMCSSHSQTATTQTQTQPPPSQKADAANQTKPTSEPKLASIYNKILEPFNKSAATETAFSPSEPEPIEIEVAQAAEPVEPISTPDVAVVPPSPVVPFVDECDEQMEEDVDDPEPVLSPEPTIPVPIEKVIPSRKEVEADNIGIVMPMPEIVVKDKQPQKAIVKPHVLTHVIEGFVIQEGSEPFPVTLPSYSITAKEEIIEKSMEPYGSAQTAEIPVIKKKEKIPKIRGGPVELAKCEFCGKLGPKAKFKRSKRFCSTSCAKRFNSGEEIRKHKKKGSSKKGGKSKKKKLGLKSKKSWKKSENKLYEEKEWNIPDVQQVQEEIIEDKRPMEEEVLEEPVEEIPSMEVEETSIAVVCEEEEESRPPTPVVETVEEPSPVTLTEFATKSPLKWTVTDVVDFVRDMPGCSDYADEFRSQEIDGQALMLLKEDHLMSLMSMKLGPALKVCAKINSMRDEINH
ncbi:polyhomeotic-like protein 2 [Caerostris darwini]|uniref:Polyhomeotic-like protein 2 n=1 Tax=Caerostris darwini TaxID=1538125 RepID=A0AAV4SEM7_9ARAC|nr:polyhomeotic-like protein 2 [Caerostris darwini]